MASDRDFHDRHDRDHHDLRDRGRGDHRDHERYGLHDRDRYDARDRDPYSLHDRDRSYSLHDRFRHDDYDRHGYRDRFDLDYRYSLPERGLSSFAGEAYRQGMHGIGGQIAKDYSLLPRDSFDDRGRGFHRRPGQTMRSRMQLRTQTDVTCGCVFIAFWCIMFWIGCLGVSNGDPRRLYHGFDYHGRLCGVNEMVASKPFLYWPDAERMELPVCVERCPIDTSQGIALPKETTTVTQGTDYRRTEILRQYVTIMTYPTKEVGGRFCIPTNDRQPNISAPVSNLTAVQLSTMAEIIINKQQYSTMTTLVEIFKDVCNAWSVLLFMVPVAIAVGYGYMCLLTYFARTVLNVVMAGLIFGSASLSFYCLYYVGDHKSREQGLFGKYAVDHPDEVSIIGMCSGLICFFLLCSSYAMVSKMEKISAVVEASGDAMWSIQLLLCMPVFEVMLKVLYTFIWMFFASHVISNGDIKGDHVDAGGHRIEGLVRSFNYSSGQHMMITIYCVGYIWGLEFITMIFKFVISYAVATWYFQPCRADMSKPAVEPDIWKQGFSFAMVYHLGSLSIGAVVIVMLYVLIPIKVVNEFFVFGATHSRNRNPVIEAIMYSCACLVKCTEEIVSFANKEAIVEMVLRGDMGFFACAGSASRVMRRAERSVMSLHGVTMIFQIINLATSAAVGVYTTFWFISNVNIYADRRSEFFVDNRIGITMIAGLIAMAVSTVFSWTVDLVSDSLLFCWQVESEDDRTHQTYAPKALRNVVMFEDVGPLKDSRLVSGAGNIPYDGMTSRSRHASPSHSRHNSPDRHGDGHGSRGSSPSRSNYGVPIFRDDGVGQGRYGLPSV